ncbi:PREDICTED: putative F-box protein At1g49610 [Camelina sativa]|uniref:F-box protein At1g49610 n=1 Tax=Camelina sativa TaxID=90675 RepID=A0ABM1RNZ5_CAMSA|nr:PREDICTED: putative F-box protein At1g49610 [Camelina sativa]
MSLTVAEKSNEQDFDSISSLPDEILQVILSFIPTKFAIRTSVLSRRWRHVWCDTPSLSFVKGCCSDRDSIGKTLARYTARKMIRFQLCAIDSEYFPDVYSWIEFAISRNVENLWVEHYLSDIPDSFYTNSSVKQLYLKSSGYGNLDPECSVSWTSLKILTLHTCNLFNESFAKILSGSPNLETLRLYVCDILYVLDLSNSPRLKTLEIESEHWLQRAKIVAPHIHSLKLRFTISSFAYSLVDVSSLTEAELDIDSGSLEHSNVYYIETIVLKMLEKLQNVEKLTFCGNFLKALTLADRHCYSFPKLKVKDLTLKTTISDYGTSDDVTSAIVRVLQHSPELKKLTLRTMECDPIIELFGLDPDKLSPEERVLLEDYYSREVETKHVASFMELVLKTTKTVEKMVVRLGPYRYTRRFRNLRQMVPMLSHDNDVSIVLIATKRWIRVSRWSKPNIEYLTSNLM